MTVGKREGTVNWNAGYLWSTFRSTTQISATDAVNFSSTKGKTLSPEERISGVEGSMGPPSRPSYPLRVLDYIVTISFGCILYCGCLNFFFVMYGRVYVWVFW